MAPHYLPVLISLVITTVTTSRPSQFPGAGPEGNHSDSLSADEKPTQLSARRISTSTNRLNLVLYLCKSSPGPTAIPVCFCKGYDKIWNEGLTVIELQINDGEDQKTCYCPPVVVTVMSRLWYYKIKIGSHIFTLKLNSALKNISNSLAPVGRFASGNVLQISRCTLLNPGYHIYISGVPTTTTNITVSGGIKSSHFPLDPINSVHCLLTEKRCGHFLVLSGLDHFKLISETSQPRSVTFWQSLVCRVGLTGLPV